MISRGARQALRRDPCRLARQVKEIQWLETHRRAIRPLPPCVAGESASAAFDKRSDFPHSANHPLQNLIHLPDERPSCHSRGLRVLRLAASWVAHLSRETMPPG